MDNKAEPELEVAAGDLEPLFSLVSGEGDGFLLGLAAGDAAGGAWDLGYSAITEQATVIAYDLIQNRRIDTESLRSALLELAGSEGEDPVYRSETPTFRAWLAGAASGQVGHDPSLDGAARSTVIGVAFRKDPEAVVRETITLGSMFDWDATSIVVSLVASTATAASCFAQAGRDLIAGVRETVVPAIELLEPDFTGIERLEGLGPRIESLIPVVGVAEADEALDAVGGDPGDPLSAVLAALLLSAPVNERFHVAVEQAARIGGSPLGAFSGALIGARLGIKGWPWAFANDTWFAEIGRRLVRGPDQIEDLPIPYAVEHHLMYGPGRGFR